MMASIALTLALAAASPREVIVLCKPQDAFSINSAPPFPAIALVLNHLGLIPRFHDMAKGLPDAAASARARGVVAWLEAGDVADPEALDAWLLARVKADQPIALLSGVGVLTERADGAALPHHVWGPLLEALDLGYDGLVEERPVGTLGYKPFKVPGAEASQSDAPHTFWDAKALPGAHAVLTLASGKQQSDVLIQGKHGAVALSPELVMEFNPVTYAARWRVDPFVLLGAALRTQNLPAPDPTTINGRRAFFAHIDGDGFNNASVQRKSLPSGRVILDEVLKRTPLPTTVSIVAGSTQGHADLEGIAREIFALPNVEAASHTFTHPHDYVAQTATAGDSVVDDGSDDPNARMKHVSLDPKHEVDDSLRFVQTLCPPGKHPAAMLWSGRTNPSPGYLARAAACGVVNINGGDARLNRHFPSITALSSYGRDVGPYTQVHSAAANENLFTNLWTGPFDGLREVIGQFKFTDEPRRLAAVNIYYHFYAGERAAGLKALLECYRWAESQPLTPVFASSYARGVEGFYSARIMPAGDAAWDVADMGTLRTLRFDHEARDPDLAASQNVAGFSRASGGRLFVHLSGPSAHLALAPAPAPHPHLQEANAPLASWESKAGRLAGTFEPTVAPRVVLSGFKPNQSLIVTGDFKGPAHADANGKLAVWAPLGQAKLEVRW
ncbi:MAG: hypothetical protein JWM80_1582 [Cyanobacteria bacterium RYN_339]|nr:hypothetical protein [Cyanobacteria bacterium RYN_339]